jgi:acylphosphatase
VTHLHVVIRGRVQGVGFRWFVVQRARAHGLRGRVWNRADGAVEAEAVGRTSDLGDWLGDLRLGPARARVEDVQDTWGLDAPGYEGFEIVG